MVNGQVPMVYSKVYTYHAKEAIREGPLGPGVEADWGVRAEEQEGGLEN